MKLLNIAVAAISVGVAVSGSIAWRGEFSPPPAKMAVSPAITVLIAPAATATVQDIYVAVGAFRAHRSVDVTARAAGQLVKFAAQEGAQIEEGDLIAQIDDALARANLQNSQTQLALAQSKYDRLAKLGKDGVSTVSSIEEARSALLAAQSTVDLRRSELDLLKIRAPFKGRVSGHALAPGAYLQPGQTISRLIDPSALEAEFAVPFDIAGRVAVGARFTVRSIGPVEWSAQAVVSEVAPEVDPTTRTIRLRGRIANDDGRILPGSIARIEFVAAERPDAVTVPEQALVTSLAGQFVYRVIDGKAARTPVTAGAPRNGVVEVTSGLSAGESVVTEGRQKLRDGMAVSVAPAAGG